MVEEATWSGPEQLEPLLVAVAELEPIEGNARRGDVALVAASLRRFGQLRPIVVTEDGTILAGKHVWQAAAEHLGWSHVAAVTVEMPSESDLVAFLVADNHLGDIATYDSAAQVRLMERLAQAEDEAGLVALGWRSHGDFLAERGTWLKRAAAEGPPEQWPDYGGHVDTDFRCIFCGFRWSGGVPS